MKKSDFNRVLALWQHSGVSTKTCMKLILEICLDIEEAVEWISLFFKEAGIKAL